jgi:hypothetical protein
MGSDAAYAIDDTSALARRARALLAGAGLDGAGLDQARASERGGAVRMLLVDPEQAELQHAASVKQSRIVLVAQALPLPGDRQVTSGAFELADGAICARNQPYLESLLPRLALGLSTGRFFSAAPAQKAAYVAHEDAAILAAALLASDFQEAHPLRVTGPTAFSHRELCAVASELFSRRVQVEEIAPEQLSAELIRRGMSAEQAALSTRGDRLLLDAHEGAPSTDGPRVTGVAALSLHAFLHKARESLQAVARPVRLPAELPSRSGLAVCAPINAP